VVLAGLLAVFASYPNRVDTISVQQICSFGKFELPSSIFGDVNSNSIVATICFCSFFLVQGFCQSYPPNWQHTDFRRTKQWLPFINQCQDAAHIDDDDWTQECHVRLLSALAKFRCETKSKLTECFKSIKTWLSGVKTLIEHTFKVDFVFWRPFSFSKSKITHKRKLKINKKV